MVSVRCLVLGLIFWDWLTFNGTWIIAWDGTREDSG
jgi:hypothetical protein